MLFPRRFGPRNFFCLSIVKKCEGVKANIEEFKQCYAKNSSLSSWHLIDHFLAEKIRKNGLNYKNNLPTHEQLRRITSNWTNDDRKFFLNFDEKYKNSDEKIF